MKTKNNSAFIKLNTKRLRVFKPAFIKTNCIFRVKWGIVFLSILVIAMPALSLAFNHEEEASRIQRAYAGFKDITGNFTQKSFIKDLKRTDTYKGRFYIKASKFRWEYTGEKPQTIYISGDKLIIHQKNEKQAYITKFDSTTYGQSPIVLLGGLGDIRSDFDISAKDSRLILRPKKPMGNIVQIEVLPSEEEFPIKSLRIIDNLSNRTDIELKDIKLNTGIKDKLFEFTPPEGVSIIKQ